MMKLEVANKSLKALVDGFPRSDWGDIKDPALAFCPALLFDEFGNW